MDGLRYLKQHVDILVITLLKASVALLVSSGFQVIQVSIAEQIFVIGHGGGISLGLMYAVVGVGTGIGPIIARQFTGDDNRRLRFGIGVGYGSAALGLLIVSFLSNFPLVLFGTLFRGIGNGLVWVFSTQLLLQLVPNRARGRVFATEFAFFTLMSATGAAVTGSALDSGMGIDDVLRWMAALTLIPGLLWLLRLMLTDTGAQTSHLQEADKPSALPVVKEAGDGFTQEG